MIRFCLAVVCCAGIALQLLATMRGDELDEPRGHIEPPCHVRPVRWALVDDDSGDAA